MPNTWRRTKDLSMLRIGAALLLTPVLMIGVCTLFLPTHFWDLTAAILPWFGILNMSHYVVALCRGRINRLGCLATGVVAALTFSDGMILVNWVIAALFMNTS